MQLLIVCIFQRFHYKQNYQCKICKRQFIGDHALSYQGCHSGIKDKILRLMVRGSGIRDIAEVERISVGKVLRTLSQSEYQLKAQQSYYDSLEVDEFWTFVGCKQNKQWLVYAYHRQTGEIVAYVWGGIQPSQNAQTIYENKQGI